MMQTKTQGKAQPNRETKDPLDFLKHDQETLYQFFKTNIGVFQQAGPGYYWKKGTIIGDRTLPFNVLKRQRAHRDPQSSEYRIIPDQFRYECFDNEDTTSIIGKGKKGVIFVKSLGSFHLDEINRINFGHPGKDRGIKITNKIIPISYLHTPDLVNTEFKMSPDEIHAKPPLIVQVTHPQAPSMLIRKSFFVQRIILDQELSDVFDKNTLSFLKRLELMMAIIDNYQQTVLNRGLIHWDIKPENIRVRLSASIEAQIIDFELATKIIDKTRVFPVGDPGYMAPELRDKTGNLKKTIGPEVQTTALDIYSLGIVFFYLWSELDTSVSSKEVLNPTELFNKLKEGEPFYTKLNRDKIRKLILTMIETDPAKRPSVADIIEQVNTIDLRTEIDPTHKSTNGFTF